MRRIYNILFGLSILGSTTLVQPVSAQQKINPVLEVKRDFDAKLLEIQKGKLNTTYSDTVGNFNLNFDYSIFDKPIMNLYEFSPLPSAQIERNSKLRYPVFYADLGANYPLNPHLNLYFQPNLPSSLSLTIYGKHDSFWGELPLVNVTQESTSRDKQMVAAPSAQNNLGLNFGYNWKGGELGLSLDYNKDFFSFYGYNQPKTTEYTMPEELFLLNPDYTILPRKFTMDYMRDTLSHVYDKFSSRLYLRSTSAKTKSFYYNIDFRYSYIGDTVNYEYPPAIFDNTYNRKFDFRENYIDISGIVGQNSTNIQKFLIAFRYQTANSSAISGMDRTNLEIHPYYTFSKHRWLFELGLRLNKYTAPNMDEFKFFIKGNASYELINNRLWFYGLLDGKNNFRTYQEMMSVNPWITPNVDIQNTIEPIIAKLGLKGQIKDRFSYHIYGGYTEYKRQMNLFYYSSIWYGPRNTFIAFYKDMRKIGAGAEFFWKSKEIESGLSFEYNNYTNNDSSTVYNFSPLELRAYARYNWRERIIFGASLHFGSKTPTLFYFDPTSSNVSTTKEYISSYATLNLDVTYAFNKKTAFYLKLNNILNSNELYNMYYSRPGTGIGLGVILNY